MFNLNPWLLLGAVLAILGILGGVYTKGRLDERAAGKSADMSRQIKSEEKYDEIYQDVVRAPVDDLKRRYCKWVRDDQDKCLQANIPISE